MAFVERQWLARNPVLWVVLPVLGIAGYAAWQDPAGAWPLLAVVVLSVLLFTGALRTSVDTDGVRLVLRPIWRRFQPWAEVESAVVEPYRWTRFGGWGIRLGRGAIAYSVWGPHAVRLLLAGKRDLVIGTRDPKALAAALELEGVRVDRAE